MFQTKNHISRTRGFRVTTTFEGGMGGSFLARAPHRRARSQQCRYVLRVHGVHFSAECRVPKQGHRGKVRAHAARYTATQRPRAAVPTPLPKIKRANHASPVSTRRRRRGLTARSPMNSRRSAQYHKYRTAPKSHRCPKQAGFRRRETYPWFPPRPPPPTPNPSLVSRHDRHGRRRLFHMDSTTTPGSFSPRPGG